MDSAYESDKASVRVKRAVDARAAGGRFHGGAVPFGYKLAYDETTGKGRLVVDDPAAGVVREVFARFNAGESIKSISEDLAARGVIGAKGTPIRRTGVRSLLLSPRYHGERHLNGQVVAQADWPAIIDKTDWLTARRILSDPGRNTLRRPGRGRPGRAKWLCSYMDGIGCAKCGRPLQVNIYKSKTDASDAKPYYRCTAGCCRAGQPDLDELVTRIVLDTLADPRNAGRLLADDSDDSDDEPIEQARLTVNEIRAELDDLASEVAAGRLSARLASRAEPGIQARLETAERHLHDLATPSALTNIFDPADNITTRWETLGIDQRRSVLAVLVPDVLGRLELTHAPRRGAPVTERVRWRIGQAQFMRRRR